jgi:hypothetical protein
MKDLGQLFTDAQPYCQCQWARSVVGYCWLMVHFAAPAHGSSWHDSALGRWAEWGLPG